MMTTMLAFSPHVPLPLASSSRPHTSSSHILSPARKPRRCTRSPCPPPSTTTPVVSQLPHTASFTSPTSKPAGNNTPNYPVNSSMSPAATAATNARQKQAHPHPVATPTITSSSPPVPPPPTSPLSPKWILSYLKGNKDLVDAAMENCIRPDARTGTLVSAMRYSLLAGGKRVRPNLAIAAFEMFAGPATGTAAEKARHLATVMPTALSVEMIHTMSLIHDDLPSMDDDDVRRGKPTNHKVYGEDIAILAGDALLAYAFEYVARHTPAGNAQRVVNVLKLLAESVGPQGLAGGQVMDLENEGQHNVPLDTLTWIHTHKTAVLLRVSCACGAILGGATDEDVERVSEFAVKTGLAFQIADDLLDVTQSTEVLGKTAGKDEVVNKATYPRLLGLEGSRRQAEQLINEAKQALAPYGERANTLIALADFIINRQN